MTTVDGYTKEKTDALMNEQVVDGSVVDGHLILQRRDASTIDAGSVVETYDIRKFGDVSGTSDYSSIVQEAINAAAVGGGIVDIPIGHTINAQGLILKSHVLLRINPGATLRLVNGANTFLIESEGFAGLTGSNDSGGVYRCGIIGSGDIDGNKANNASATAPLVRLYGYDLKLSDFTLHNANAIGLYTEWADDASDPTPHSMEAAARFIKVHDCGSHGIQWKGPHDSVWIGIQSFHNDGRGFDIQTNYGEYNGGALIAFGCHGWGNRLEAWYFGGVVSADQCVGEGSSDDAMANVVIAVNDCEWIGGSLFRGGPSGYTNVGLRIGDTTDVLGTLVVTKVLNCPAGVLNLAHDGGANLIHILAYGEDPLGVSRTGTVNRNSECKITGVGIDVHLEWIIPHGAQFRGLVSAEQTATEAALDLITTATGDKRIRQRFVANGVELFSWITDRNLDGSRDMILWDSVAGAARMLVNTGGVVGLVGGLGVGGNAAASGPVGTVVGKFPVYDVNGNALGYVPIYNAIT